MSCTAVPSDAWLALSTVLLEPSLTVVAIVAAILVKVFVKVQTIASPSAARLTPLGTEVPVPLVSADPFFVQA